MIIFKIHDDDGGGGGDDDDDEDDLLGFPETAFKCCINS
jgi:hypothetical protein